ncbi:MAG: hypothetical protein ACFN3I_12830, partial [Arachnia propionica]
MTIKMRRTALNHTEKASAPKRAMVEVDCSDLPDEESDLNEDKETLTPVLYFEGEDNGFQVEVALQYNDGFSDNILSFVN